MLVRNLIAFLLLTAGLMSQSSSLPIAIFNISQETPPEAVKHSEARVIQIPCSKKPTLDDEINLRAQALLRACDQVCSVFQRKEKKVEMRDVLPLTSIQKARWDAKTKRYIVEVKIQGSLKVAAIKLPEGAITGLIVDCRGMGMRPCMSPRILAADGTEIWGNVQADADVVIGHGIAGWAKSEEGLSQAELQKRLGNNPLRLTAIEVEGFSGCNAVLSEEDAETVKRENQRWKFLDKLAVVFLY